MPKYEDSVGIESEHSPDNELSGLDLSVIPGPEKVHTKTNESLCCSTREKNVVSRFGYNDYMSYHYAFIMKVATVQEPEMFFEAAKDPWWVEAMNMEMQARRCKGSSKTKLGITFPLHPTKRQSVVGGYSRWSKCQRHRQSILGSACGKRVCTDTRDRLRTDLCPSGKDDYHSHYDRTHNNKRVASPPNGCKERLPTRQVRGGGVHGWCNHLDSSRVCIKKPLYNLKQAPRAWHSKIT